MNRKVRGKFFRILFSMLCLGLGLVAICQRAGADEVQTIQWSDLIPPEDLAKQQNTSPIDHSGSAPAPQMSVDETHLRYDLNGKTIRLAGYMVPLDGDEGKVTAFLLVPFFGACIHVPPPPVNQIISVDYMAGVDADIIYDPVWIVGRIFAGKVGTEMAVAGYSMTADKVTPYTD